MPAPNSDLLTFQIKVIQGSTSLPKGTYSAELSDRTLSLRKGQRLIAEFKSLTAVQRKNLNTLVLAEGSSPITFQVLKINGYLDILTDAIMDVLSGHPPVLRRENFEFPKLLLIVAALPLGLVGLGGLVGGAIGGAVTGLNLYFARQHRWPLVIRVISMLTTTGSIFSLYALFLSLVLYGNSKQQLTQTTPPLSTTTPLPSAIETPSAPKPVAITALMSSGVFRMGVTQTEATSAIVADDRVSLIIGCEDGTIRNMSLLDQEPNWKVVAKLPSAPRSFRRIAADYFLVSCSNEKFLITPQHKLLRVFWKWECIPSASILFLATDSEMLTGSINFGTIEKVAETSSNGLDDSVIQSLPTSFLESKDGPALSVDSPASLSHTEITACGTNPIAFGYRDGTIALKVSGEWIVEKTRNKSLSCIGQGNGFGFSDGIVDTGIVEEKLRFRPCGDSSILRLYSHQVWTIAINQQGEAWAFIPQDPAAARRVFAETVYGELKEILPMDNAIAVVGRNNVAFLTTQEFTSNLKSN
jgi:hypothetical protein